MRQIWIDCDPGHDDAMAILTAIANPEKLKILGISTVGGNQTIEKVTTNAKNILEFVHSDIPLAKGQDKPLVKPLNTAPEAHGDSGMDGSYFNGTYYPVVSENAVEYMYHKIMESKEKTTLVALAPLTNLALLLKVYPEVKEKIECISMMGGGISHGNCTELAEFNIYVDPEAAHIVFHSGISVIMAGLDVTENAAITLNEIKTLKDKGKVSHLAYELLSFYNESGKQFGFIDSPIHDLCAVEYLIKPEIFSGKNYYVDIVTDNGISRGQTLADLRKVPKHKDNVFVLKQVDRKKFVETLVEGLEKLDKEV
ncbi:nucleoside hydrolase [Gardnerella vaginalis]|uniref:nucleoside hydrolase n=1 Tax=Gardnerella vaginalis TaxID=2702 RepID=UPI000C7AED5B|nr:nucleoside hydrolase [Gardnerella vaginalis]MDK8337831.1 nucleoside hydrolase [Gardnerella vaginalis]PKZ56705.1 pyrimidine-specific ribonucleoside hydrolase RihA [Gardnerella vaginalis]PKZ74392.1 pyrimidine-specific ribonucleoside hydrolase RihA [Gardnerella vaginalis]PNP87915.1 pyrimidine-specific ribonucleoside hydrolase RihA [Gardnerella vaginalis]